MAFEEEGVRLEGCRRMESEEVGNVGIFVKHFPAWVRVGEMEIEVLFDKI